MALAAGQPIFQEVALVSSTFGDSMDANCCDHHHDVELDEPQNEPLNDDEGERGHRHHPRPAIVLDDDDVDAMSPAVLDAFDALMSHCNNVPVLSMVDVRKNLFKLLRLHELDPSHESLLLLHTLPIDTDDLAAYATAATSLRAAFAAVVPSTLSDDDVAHFIGVLNHNCVPNCNLTVTGTTMWVTAITAIDAGQILTVDAADLFYRPAHERRQFLAVDKISCQCDLCGLRAPDLARTFCRDIYCLNYTLPYPHDEKVQHYDHLAQTLVAIGDIPGAAAAYEAAYTVSCLCSGRDYDESQLYHRLMSDTPTTKEDLLRVYKHGGELE
ncbi:hypothetical protein B5M09_012403 [Aphanomyces astaci]|uniref:Uncharacterized protein n=1 Tax=Aphanomyces astaci TaxID=112090 RepID=A0A3R8DPD1_APHAT|nr:hypothetical protein B5M09_012403 [Aphanomyces astaci]